jgi:hypothetical protein
LNAAKSKEPHGNCFIGHSEQGLDGRVHSSRWTARVEGGEHDDAAR